MKGARACLLAVLAMFTLFPGLCGGREDCPTTPKTKDGARSRVGYYEGGPYVNYPANLREIARGLMELGWIGERRIPESEDPTDARGLWQWLATNGSRRYIHFVGEACWSAEFK